MEAVRGHIRLAGREPFAVGGNRYCFEHPEDARRCVKVLRPGCGAAEKRERAPVWKRLRPESAFDENLREWRAYRRIRRDIGDEAWRHLPRCHGLVGTDIGGGVGIVTDLVRNADGTISGSLKIRLRAAGNDPHFRLAVERFSRFLRDTGLPTRDLLLHNLVAREETRSGNGPFSIIMVDGFGVSDGLPTAFGWRRFPRHRIERKLRKFDGRIGDFCEKYAIPYRQ